MAEPTSNRLQGLRVAVTGASGNVGTALLRRLTAPGSGVAEVRGLARRQPPSIPPYDGVRWYQADLGETRSEHELTRDRKSVVEGKSVDLGGRRIIKKKINQIIPV